MDARLQSEWPFFYPRKTSPEFRMPCCVAIARYAFMLAFFWAHGVRAMWEEAAVRTSCCSSTKPCTDFTGGNWLTNMRAKVELGTLHRCPTVPCSKPTNEPHLL